MIICSCGKKIEYFVVIAHHQNTSLNRKNRPAIIYSYFFCGECTKKKIRWWNNHNKGRTEPYLIKKAKVNVIAETKKEFIQKVNPQLFKQFSVMGQWLPKSDIQSAVKELKKG